MNSLQIDPASPWWLHLVAGLLLYAHIIGGTVGLVSGAAAMSLRKGFRGHRIAGNWFFGSMLVMAAIGGAVSPFLRSAAGEPKWFDAAMGLFTFYLVATGWMTVRRKAGTAGNGEIAAFAFAALLAGAVLALGLQAASSPTGSLGGYEPSAYFVIGGIIALAAWLDLKVIRRGGCVGPARIARHVWRMSTALFIAAGAFFLGQQRLMPEVLHDSPLLLLPPLSALLVMLWWLLKLRFAKRINGMKRRFRAPRKPLAGA